MAEANRIGNISLAKNFMPEEKKFNTIFVFKENELDALTEMSWNGYESLEIRNESAQFVDISCHNFIPSKTLKRKQKYNQLISVRSIILRSFIEFCSIFVFN